MKYLLPLAILLYLSSCSVTKKTEKAIYGKWEIISMNTQTISEAGESFNKTINDMVSNSYIIFKEDKSFNFSILSKMDQGTWTISDDAKTIILKEKPYLFEIVEISENTLLINQIKQEKKVLFTLRKTTE